MLADRHVRLDGRRAARRRRARVMEAMVDTLGDDDRLEMIEFSNAPRRWLREPARWPRPSGEAAARAWVRGLRASGGTEMRDGALEALAPLRADAQRQVVLVTDGPIGFEQEIVRDVLQRTCRAPSRLHTVGVGSAVNRSLTRAGGARGARRRGDHRPRRGSRARRAAAPRAHGGAARGRSGDRRQRARRARAGADARPVRGRAGAVRAGAAARRRRARRARAQARRRVAAARARGAGRRGSGRALVALFGREHVADLEMRAARARRPRRSTRDRAGRPRLPIATRLTSWLAVAETRRSIPAPRASRDPAGAAVRRGGRGAGAAPGFVDWDADAGAGDGDEPHALDGADGRADAAVGPGVAEASGTKSGSAEEKTASGAERRRREEGGGGVRRGEAVLQEGGGAG